MTAHDSSVRFMAPPGKKAGGAPRALRPPEMLSLLRRRHAERRVARAARVATEILDDVLRRLRVAGGGGRLEPRTLRLHLLGRRLELRPLLPDLRLGLRLLGHRTRREQRRNLRRVLRDDVGVGGDHGPVAGLGRVLHVLPRVAVLLHHLLALGNDLLRRLLRLLHARAGAREQTDARDHDGEADPRTLHASSLSESAAFTCRSCCARRESTSGTARRRYGPPT